MRHAAGAAALAGLALAGGPALSAADCILDNCADRRPPVVQGARRDGPLRDPGGSAGPRGRSRPGDFDFYVLALSWTPGFCAVGGGDEKGRDQCRRGAGLGFTVHGLWPQYERGFPSDCRGDTYPSRAALATAVGLYPDPGLARHEWRRHGTCSGLSPTAYFAAVRNARAAVIVPAVFAEAHDDRHLTATAVVRAFTDANPRLRPGMLAAVCRAGVLDEVRICLDKDLKGFRACPGVVRGGCRSGEIDVPPLR